MKMANWTKGKNMFVVIGMFFASLFLFTSCGPNISKKVRVGMSQTEVRSLCGSPTHKEISYSLNGTKEEWVYKGFFKVYNVVFLDGRVVAIYEKGM